MNPLERTLADYKNSGITVGPHIMKHLRNALAAEGVLRAADVRRARDGRWVKIAGLVIVRQRPGTAKGFCFLTLEDETGTANAVVVPDMFQRHRALIHVDADDIVSAAGNRGRHAGAELAEADNRESSVHGCESADRERTDRRAEK